MPCRDRCAIRIDEPTRDERVSDAKALRARGLCPKCRRPMKASIFGDTASLYCCDQEQIGVRGTRLFKLARERIQLQGASK